MSLDLRMHKLKEVQRGWINYFKYANIVGKLGELDGCLHNRIRCCIFHDWNRALASSPTPKKKSSILGTTFTISRLTKRGYEPMLSYYYQVNPSSQIPSLLLVAERRRSTIV